MMTAPVPVRRTCRRFLILALAKFLRSLRSIPRPENPAYSYGREIK